MKLMKNEQVRQFVFECLHELIAHLELDVCDGSDGDSEEERKILDVYKVIDYIKDID